VARNTVMRIAIRMLQFGTRHGREVRRAGLEAVEKKNLLPLPDPLKGCSAG
jgi:hypothetical protein